MSQTELGAGADRDAIGLARRVVDTQNGEIAEMGTLLGQL
jgi:uncharacterized protein (DUF305 family)